MPESLEVLEPGDEPLLAEFVAVVDASLEEEEGEEDDEAEYGEDGIEGKYVNGSNVIIGFVIGLSIVVWFVDTCSDCCCCISWHFCPDGKQYIADTPILYLG